MIEFSSIFAINQQAANNHAPFKMSTQSSGVTTQSSGVTGSKLGQVSFEDFWPHTLRQMRKNQFD